MSRYRRGIRQASMKSVVGIAAAALVGGGAIGAAAMAATASSAPVAAQSAAYGWTAHTSSHQQVALDSAMSFWKRSQQRQHNAVATAMAQLATTQDFATIQAGGMTLAAQVGVELVNTRHFLVLQSANGTVEVWVLSGDTEFKNVSGSTTGTTMWEGSRSLAKGDTIFVEGAMRNGDLDAQLVMVSSTSTTTTPTATPTATMPTTTTSPTGTATTPTTAPTTTTPTTTPTTTKPTSMAPTSATPTSGGTNSTQSPPPFGGKGS